MSRRRTGPRQQSDRMAAVMKLLGLLAQRGTHVPAPLAGGSEVVVRLAAPGGVTSEIGRFPVPVLAEAEAQGWIDGAVENGRLGLTVAGRRALKEARSRLSQIKAAELLGGPNAGVSSGPGINPAESPLGWLRSRRDSDGRPMISDAQFAAGERLRAELTFAQLTPRITMAWSGIAISSGASGAGAGTTRDLADNVVAARARVTLALRAVGPEFAGILIDVCGHLKGLEVIARAEGWPNRSAKLLLQRALTALARHYGLIAEVPVEQTIAQRLRHWGAADYRPTLADSSERGQDD